MVAGGHPVARDRVRVGRRFDTTADGAKADSTITTLAASEPDDGGDVFTENDGVDVVASPSTAAANATPPAPTTSATTIPPGVTSAAPVPTAPPTTTTTAPPATAAAAPSATAAPTPAGGGSPCPPTGQRVWEVRPASDIAAPPLPAGWRTESAGSSVQVRDLAVLVRPVEAPARTVMVIGGIHGNVPVSPHVVRALVDVAIPDDTEVWLLPLLNPDGSAIRTRCNANGVDFNRNCSWGWRAGNGGPAAFSDPEPAAVAVLVERVAPDVVERSFV